jgi:hypothetical protein
MEKKCEFDVLGSESPYLVSAHRQYFTYKGANELIKSAETVAYFPKQVFELPRQAARKKKKGKRKKKKGKKKKGAVKLATSKYSIC